MALAPHENGPMAAVPEDPPGADADVDRRGPCDPRHCIHPHHHPKSTSKKDPT